MDAKEPLKPSKKKPCVKPLREPMINFLQEELCSICGKEIPNYIPDYFMGERINPACSQCKVYNTDDDEDPYGSFPESEMPVTLVSHWSQPPTLQKQSMSSFMSLRAHYIKIPNPGDSFMTTKEILREFKMLWDEDRKSMREECKQS